MQSQLFERDGIAYVISISMRQDQYVAHWTCPVCSCSGSRQIAYPTVAEARGRTEANVFTDHHVPRHVLSAP
jgi:hypothetical protein